jgi:hypothetical protein
MRHGFRAPTLILICLICNGYSQNADSVAAADSARAYADTAYGWKNSALGNLNLSQAHFDNWSKGGTDALAWELRLEGRALKKEEATEWESKGKALYGQSRVEGLGVRKASDELTLETMYTYKWKKWVNPFASARFQSQFTAGFEYDDSLGTRDRVSGPFDPSYLTQTVGLGRAWTDAYRVRVGGTLKETFSAAAYGYADDEDTPAEIETFKIEPGASLIAEIRQEIMENVLFTSVADVFANFKGARETDVRWENQLTAKVNRWISANAALDVLYDRDISARRQIRQSLGIGISFLTL